MKKTDDQGWRSQCFSILFSLYITDTYVYIDSYIRIYIVLFLFLSPFLSLSLPIYTSEMFSVLHVVGA